MTEQAPSSLEKPGFRDSRLGQIAISASIGAAWGIGTFEGVKGIEKLAFNQPFTNVRDQLLGLGIFGLGGTVAFGRFVYKQMNGNTSPDTTQGPDS